MRPSSLRLALALTCVPLLSSCVFLLDYDELTTDAGKAGSSQGGSAGSAGASGSNAGGDDSPAAGAGGSAAGCEPCDDGDPCTLDACDESGAEPTCTHTLQEGLVLDGVDETVEAEAHLRVSLVAGGQSFYLSVLSADEDTADVTLYRLASDGSALETLDSVSSLRLEGTVLSTAGLALDPAVGGLALHGFIAMQPRLPGSTPKVFHLVNRNGRTTASLVGSSYRSDNPWVFPQALTIGSRVFGAWIQEDGTIAVHDLGDDSQLVLGSPEVPANTLSLLSTSIDEPAVMYTSQTEADGAVGTFVETSTGVEAVQECQEAPGAYVSSSVISTQLPGVWLGEITRAGDDYLTTGDTTLVCDEDGCQAVTDACSPSDLSNSVRNIAGATLHFETDPAGLIYSALAVPRLAIEDGADGVQAKLALALGRADFSAQGKGASETVGPPLELSTMLTSEEQDFTGPDWPAVGILPSRQVAVAWLQPNPDRSGSELRVQRYKMCVEQD